MQTWILHARVNIFTSAVYPKSWNSELFLIIICILTLHLVTHLNASVIFPCKCQFVTRLVLWQSHDLKSITWFGSPTITWFNNPFSRLVIQASNDHTTTNPFTWLVLPQSHDFYSFTWLVLFHITVSLSPKIKNCTKNEAAKGRHPTSNRKQCLNPMNTDWRSYKMYSRSSMSTNRI